MAEQQVAAVAQAGVQPTHQRTGGVPTEVDGHVAAENQVEAAGRRRVEHQVVMTQLDQLAHLRPNLVPTVGAGQEEAVDLGAGGQLDGARAVDAGAGTLQGALGDVGGDHLDVPAVGAGHQLAEHHRDRVRLLARRAASAPDPQPPTVQGGVPQQLRQDVLAQRPHLRRVAEEVRLLDGHLVEQPLALRRPGGSDQVEVRRDGRDSGHAQPLADRVAERFAAGSVEDQAGRAGEQQPEPGEVGVVEHDAGVAHASARPSAPSSAGAICSSGSWCSTAPSACAAAGMP